MNTQIQKYVNNLGQIHDNSSQILSIILTMKRQSTKLVFCENLMFTEPCFTYKMKFRSDEEKQSSTYNLSLMR